MGPTLLQSSSLTCRYTRMSSKNDLVGGLTDPFEGLSRTTPLETYRVSTKLGDTSLDTEAFTGTASGWMGIEDTLVRVDVDKAGKDARTTPTWNYMMQDRADEPCVLDSGKGARADDRGTAGQPDVAREAMADDTGGVPQTFARTIVTTTEAHGSFKADCNTDSQGTECWRETEADAREEQDSPKSIDRCAYRHVPMEDVDNEDEKLRMRSGMREEPTCS